jgi:putative heme-binding domain-containing protein
MKTIVTLLPSLLAMTAIAAEPKDPFKELVRPTEPLSPEQQRAVFHLPPGFEIQLVASEPDLRKPMNMQWDALGRLWLTESREYPFPAPEGTVGRDSVRIFSDFAPDGRARKIEVFADGLNIPIGLYPFRSPDAQKPAQSSGTRAHSNWKCVVWSIPNIWLLEDTDGDGKADKREVLYGPLGWERDTHGNLASFRRGTDGWLYGTHGFNNQSTLRGRDGSELSIQSGNTWRVRLDGSRVEGWTWGQVNPFGLAWDPRGNLFSADCHSSPIYQLLRGAYYPSFGKPHDGVGFAPQTVTHSHGSTAICGLVYVSDPAWPAEWQDHMLVGNVQTSRINHDAIHWNGSSSKGEELPDFLSTDDPWFRPVDLSWGPDGALYIADFYNRIIGHYEVPLTHPGRDRERGRLWRIVYRGGSASGLPPSAPSLELVKTREPAARGLPTGLAGWVKELASGNLTRRTLALNELCDVYGQESLAAIQSAFAAPENGFQKLNALAALHRLGALDESTLLASLRDADPLVRIQATKLGAETLSAAQSPTNPTLGGAAKPSHFAASQTPAIGDALRAALTDSDAFVRRAAVQALAVAPAAKNVPPLLALLGTVQSGDDHLAHSGQIALRNQLREPAVLSTLAIEKETEQNRPRILDALLAVPGEASAQQRLKFFESPQATPGINFSKHLRSLAGQLPLESLEPLVALAHRRFGGNPEESASAIESLLAGLEQRTIKPTPALRAWAKECVSALLSGAPQSATVTQTAAEIVRILALPGHEEALSKIAMAKDAPQDTRAAAVRAVLSVNADRFLSLLAPMLGDISTPNALRQKVAGALAETKSVRASTAILNALQPAPYSLQKSYATALSGYPGGAEALLAACTDGKAPAALLQDQTLLTRLKALQLPDLQSRVAKLTANLPPTDKLLEKIIAERRSSFDPSKANVTHGAGLFERNCAVCHALEGKGGAIGPQLDGIGSRGSDRLFEDILDPSRNVDRAFRITLVTLKNGTVLSGLPRREDETQLFLASTDPASPETRVLKSEISERKETETSLMPAVFSESISPSELNDLLAFLLTKRSG